MTFGHGTFDINAFGVSKGFVKRAETSKKAEEFSGGYVKIFQHCKDDAAFPGWVKEFGEGEYDVGDGDFVNDDASALWIPDGYKVTLRQHGKADSNFPGTEVELYGPLEVPCLAAYNYGFNDEVSNILVEPIQATAQTAVDTGDTPGDSSGKVTRIPPNEEGEDCLEMFDEHKKKSLYPNMGSSDLLKPEKRLEYTGVGQCACVCLADPDCVAFHIATDHADSQHIDKCWFWSKDVADDILYDKLTDERPPTSKLGPGDEGNQGRQTNSYILKPNTKVQEILASRETDTTSDNTDTDTATPTVTVAHQQVTQKSNLPLIIGGSVAALVVVMMMSK